MTREDLLEGRARTALELEHQSFIADHRVAGPIYCL